jgi:predicted HTH domain antitoxin
MQKFEIAVPDEAVAELEPYQDRMAELLLLGLQQLKIREALVLYERGLVSIARAAELAGVTREEMIRQARVAGVTPRWSAEMASQELA